MKASPNRSLAWAVAIVAAMAITTLGGLSCRGQAARTERQLESHALRRGLLRSIADRCVRLRADRVAVKRAFVGMTKLAWTDLDDPNTLVMVDSKSTRIDEFFSQNLRWQVKVIFSPAGRASRYTLEEVGYTSL